VGLRGTVVRKAFQDSGEKKERRVTEADPVKRGKLVGKGIEDSKENEDQEANRDPLDPRDHRDLVVIPAYLLRLLRTS
jgi:hypothetical protein